MSMASAPEKDDLLRTLRRLAAVEVARPEDAEKIGYDTRLASMGLDSIAAVSFIVEIEVHFKIRLPPLLLFECQTVGDVVDRIAGILAAPRA